MLRISAAEKLFIEGGVESGIRSDGRGRLDFRHLTLETGITSQANGMRDWDFSFLIVHSVDRWKS